MLIEQRPDRYLRAPRLTAIAGAGAALDAIAWEPGGERRVRFMLSSDGEVVSESAGALHSDGIMALSEEACLSREGDSAALLIAHCAHTDELAVVEHEGPTTSVVLERAGARVVVFSARGMAAAPALATTPLGTWVAFHHDVREDTGATDVAKWIALRFVDRAGVVHACADEMRDRDRDLAGEEQSFEFPSLVVGADGAVALFGRGSHCFWRQDVRAGGFSPRQPLSEGEWGSRGRWVAVARLDDGALLTAQREKKGLLVRRLEGPVGGAPRLRRIDEGAGRHADHQSEATPPGYVRTSPAQDPATRHGRRTYFGDIQQHSAHSDGVGSADEVYLRARHRYGDDFVALTDHESFLGKRTGPGEWAYLQDVADRHDEPGAFATLIAYEWTGRMYPGPGHKCVYLPRRGMHIVSRDTHPEGREAVAAIAALGGFASPHHIGWTGCDEPGHDPVGQPVWEICSCHGCYEHADHPLGARGEHTDQLVDVMLAKGHRFGFTASSDSHGLLWHHGESRKRDPYRTGLTAVQVESLERDAIFEALRTRRCYGTSGAKIMLDMTVDGQPMGSELPAPGDGASLDVEVEAYGESALERIDLVSNLGVVATMSKALDDDEQHAGDQTVRDDDARHGALRATLTKGVRYVYARVVQRDGEMAWASPVFIG